MKKKQSDWWKVIAGLAVLAGLAAALGLLFQGLRQAPATTEPTATEIAAQTAVPTPSPQPTVLPPTESAQASTAPTTVPTTETTSVPEKSMTITATTVTTAKGQEMLSLQLDLDISSMAPPVQEIVYVSWVRPTDYAWADSFTCTIWTADVQNTTDSRALAIVSLRPDEFVEHITLSPDGNWIAYGVPYGNYGDLELRVTRIDGAEHRTLDIEMAPIRNAETFLWSPDSAALVYKKEPLDLLTEEPTDQPSGEVYQVQLATAEKRLLFSEKASVILIGWSPDGLEIYYAQWIPWEGQLYIRAFQLDSGQSRELAYFEAANLEHASLSPDGRHILLKVQEKDGPIAFWVVAADGTETFRLKKSGSLGEVLWTPDSQGIVYLGAKRRETPSPSFSERGLFAISVDRASRGFAGNTTVRFEVPRQGQIWLLNWSPDGRYVMYENHIKGQDYHYYLVDTATGNRQEIEGHFFDVAGWIGEKQ